MPENSLLTANNLGQRAQPYNKVRQFSSILERFFGAALVDSAVL